MRSVPFGKDSGPKTALLGPTNTGKTHLAVEKMLCHRSGMIGFPLRLLAREIYDRVTAQVGVDSTALITGEERRIGRSARYFLCTVESMPDRPVDFLAVDEAQLAAHRDRGHVFTDRLMNARGVRETMFLGSDVIANVLPALVQGVEIERRPRFSKLTHAGHRALSSLPPRTAIVAFSAAQVYEVAERIRARHGGAAVVMGALSPRTRNAQIAMYQSGAVPYLVATDAIGMGLNMDVDHVAFAATRKFDGRRVRSLTIPELAQIAGRAGRFRKDGTFGTTLAADPLTAEDVAALESHRFEPIETIRYRNSELSFASVAALRHSLRAAPPQPFLIPTRDAEDELVLRTLAEDPRVLERATGRERVETLWQVCRIPDFRKTLTCEHPELLTQIFLALTQGDGCLPEDWLSHRVERLCRLDGDIETLMARLAWIRTWTYVSFRSAWLQRPRYWQERTRELEDRLSDSLHEQLTERFVDRVGRTLGRVAGTSLKEDAVLGADDSLRLGGTCVGRVEGFRLILDPDLRPGIRSRCERMGGSFWRAPSNLVFGPWSRHPWTPSRFQQQVRSLRMASRSGVWLLGRCPDGRGSRWAFSSCSVPARSAASLPASRPWPPSG